MKKLFVYLLEYRKESVLGPLFKLIEAGFELAVPLVVAAIIDRGIGGQDRGYIVKMSLALVASGSLGVSIGARIPNSTRMPARIRKTIRRVLARLCALAFFIHDHLIPAGHGDLSSDSRCP